MTQSNSLETPEDGMPVKGLAGVTHRTSDGNGARIHFVTGGTGPAIVLLHGYPYTWAVWKPILIPLIEAGYTVFAPDLRGLGYSEKTQGGYDKETVAEDVRSMVRSAGFDTVRLIGADIGAMVAYAYASRHPAEVERLVFAESLVPGFGLEDLMNPANGGYWHFGFHAQVEVATMLTAGREDQYLLPWYSMMSVKEGATNAERQFLPFYRAAGGMRAGFRYYETLIADGQANRTQFAGKLQMPTLVLNGERGIPQAQTLACVERVSQRVEQDIVPGAGHTFASDNPDWTVARLLRFFDTGGAGDKTGR